MQLKGKTAVITGGGQGIGKAIAKRFLEEGSNVVVAEYDAEAGRETEEELKNHGAIRYIHTDVANEEMVKGMISATLEHFGKIDFLINNAGIFASTPLAALTLDEWNSIIAVNLTSVFLCTKYAVPHLKKNKGAIVNIASTRAVMSEPDTEAYAASKGGIVALTHALAISLGPDVRVNCISPGWIDVSEWKKGSKRQVPELRESDHTQHPAGRVGKPEDIATLALFLINTESSFITGAHFVADGGMTRKMIYI